MRRFVTLPLVVCAAAGCGVPEQQRVQATLRASDAAWERKDYAAVCALRTEAGRREWARIGGARTCVEGIERVAALATAPPEPSLGTLTVTLTSSDEPNPARIRVDGDTAVVYYRLGAGEWLRKVDGRWLIDAGS